MAASPGKETQIPAPALSAGPQASPDLHRPQFLRLPGARCSWSDGRWDRRELDLQGLALRSNGLGAQAVRSGRVRQADTSPAPQVLSSQGFGHLQVPACSGCWGYLGEQTSWLTF